MANQVTFQIKIETTGAESVKHVTMDAEELRRVVEEVTESQDKLNTKLLDINQAQEAIENITQGIRGLCDEVEKYTSAYAQQEVAERQLAQVMKNTMDARDEDVESIKKLCAAQQELGVIGDEVQLAGAQELATYLEKKSSLEQLIPVMNDMLAQQYELDATQENAAQIATMLGKVMEGQTQALSRYGYSFTEAQEQILKFGTEEDRAAVLADVVSQSVGGMNQALAQTDSGKAKQLANTIGDIKEEVGACVVSLQPFLSTLSEIGLSVQGIMSVTQGIRGLTVSIASLTVVQRGWHVAAVTTTAVVRTLTTVMQGGTVAATTLKIALRGLMIATGVGAAITVLTFAIERLMNSSEGATAATEDLTEAESAEEAQMRQTRAGLELQIEKLRNFTGTKAQEKKMVEELNATYGTTMGYFSSVSEWYQALVKNSEAYCEQMVIEARMRQLANAIATEQGREKGTATELAESVNKVTEMRQELKALAAESAKIKMPVLGAAAAPQHSGQAAGRKKDSGERVRTSQIGALDLSGISAEIDLTPRIDEAKALKDLNNLGWEVEMKVDAEGLKKIEAEAEQTRRKFEYAAGSVDGLGSSLKGLGDAIGVPELDFAGTMAGAIATLVQGFATATSQSATMGPWAWLSFGALGLAQLTAMITSVKNLGKFADGCVAFGPTLGLFGEYANAATNPEVVAPLDKLRSLTGGDGGSVREVEFHISGRDLVAVMKGHEHLLKRS